MRWSRRAREEHEAATTRADRLDAALDAWHPGEVPAAAAFDAALRAEPLGDALAAAEALREYAAGVSPAREARVALRAALAARAASAAARSWRTTVTRRVAPVLAVAAAVIGAVLVLPSSRAGLPTELAVSRTQENLVEASRKLEQVRIEIAASPRPDPAALQDTIAQAVAAAAAAQASAQFADGAERRQLLARVDQQQAEIRVLRAKVQSLLIVTTTTTSTTTPSSTTTTSTTEPRTTTTRPSSTTTSAPSTTSTTVASSTTSEPPTTTTSTSPPPPAGDFGTGTF